MMIAQRLGTVHRAWFGLKGRIAIDGADFLGVYHVRVGLMNFNEDTSSRV